MSAAVKLTRAEELNAIGARFFREGQMEPARLHFLAALTLEPNQPQVLQNLGAVLRQLGHVKAAASVARRSIAAAPENPFCKSNYGVSLLALKQFEAAIDVLKETTFKFPNAGEAFHNYGLALYMVGKRAEALKAFERAIAIGMSSPSLLSDRALALISLGRLEEGLAFYECRWNILKRNHIWQFGIPEWQGEVLKGRRILVHEEQGFGDTLMLCRFVKQLAEKRAFVTLAVRSELLKLMTDNFPYVKVVELSSVQSPEEFDYHSPLLSVMRWLDLKDPKNIDSRPYLRGNPLTPIMNLPDAAYKVGLVWASGDHGAVLRDRRRIIDVTEFLPLSEIPNVSVISLQVGDHSNDIVANGMEGLIFDVSMKLDDFAVTADMIARLNIVISVDSAVCHLAAAMGKPVLMLSPYTRCWRWWHSTTGWPWYQRMTIFQQQANGSWNDAARAVTRAVRSYVSGIKEI